MALIIEDGTSIADAEAFATAGEYKAWAGKFFNETVSVTDSAIEAAIHRTIAYMNSLKWIGSQDHELCFPRDGATDIPKAVINAQHAFTRAELETPNALSPSVQGGTQSVLKKAGDIEFEIIQSLGNDRQNINMAMDFIRSLVVSNVKYLTR
jgi:hypothetical protein